MFLYVQYEGRMFFARRRFISHNQKLALFSL